MKEKDEGRQAGWCAWGDSMGVGSGANHVVN